MREQGGSFALTAAKFGGKRLGQGTALVDEDVLRLLLLDASGGEKTLQIRYDAIAGVALRDETVVVSCRDDRSLVAATEDAAGFRQALLAACRSLPEVTRALRALGSRRGRGGARRGSSEREGRFFAPFIAARRASMDARDARTVVAAFGPRGLSRALASTITEFASELGAGRPARQRAIEAELSDAVESLEAALATLEERAALAASDVDDLDRWRSWAAGVQDVFEAADRAWVAIEPLMERQ